MAPRKRSGEADRDVTPHRAVKAPKYTTQGASRAAAALVDAPGAVYRDDVVDLQQVAGNKAVTRAVQRDKTGAMTKTGPVDVHGMPVDKRGIPTRGPDVRAELQTRFPGLLGALTEKQLAQWQAVVDWQYIERARQAKLFDLDYGDLPPQTGFQGPRRPYHRDYGELWEQMPQYKQARRALEAGRKARPSEEITVDAQLLFSADMYDEPEWDVAAEMKFRQSAVDRVTKSPLKLDVRPSASVDEALAQWPLPVRNTKGFITPESLKQHFQKEYREQVSERAELKELQKVLELIRDSNIEMRAEHQQRSDINARRIGFGIVRHVAEAVGSGGAPYPSMKMWDKADALFDKAIIVFNEGQFELAVPLIAMAEKQTVDSVNRYLAYEKRVTSGASRVVRGLELVKQAGSIAAGVASGGLGLTGAALATGAYQGLQDTAQQAMEVHYGHRKRIGITGILKNAGLSAAMTVMGGALSARFEGALKARFAKMGMGNTWFAERATSAIADMTSSLYTTALDTAIQQVANGKAFPTSAAAFGELVLDNAAKDVVMGVMLSGANRRATEEYHAWKTGRAKPAVGVPALKDVTTAVAGKPGAVDPAAVTKAVELAPHQLSEQAVRRLLSDIGGFERLRYELNTGTGLGSGMGLGERKALLHRFEAHREVMARNVASVFDGKVVVSQGRDGRELEVQFAGDNTRVKQAQEYLDAKSPGWENQTGLKLAAALPAPTSVRAADALEIRLTAEAQHLAARFAPIYDQWKDLKTPDARFAELLKVVNAPLVAAGAPPLRPKYLENPPSSLYGKNDHKTWELFVNKDLLAVRDPNPAQFAAVCDTLAHEARHALQWFRMARIDPAGVSDMDPIAKMAALEANAGTRPAEPLAPGSIEYKNAKAFLASVYSPTAGAERNKILADLDRAGEAKDEAYKLAEKTRKELPENHPWRIEAEQRFAQAQATHDDVHLKYSNLVEEIDARRHGRAVGISVHRLVNPIREARAREFLLRGELQAAENKVVRVRLPSNPAAREKELERRKEERDAAKRRHEAAWGILKKLEKQLEQLTAQGSP